MQCLSVVVRCVVRCSAVLKCCGALCGAVQCSAVLKCCAALCGAV